MARPINNGLEYFPLDVDFWDDPKILIIEEQFGVKGSYVANRLLCWIYRNGYFLEWNNDMALIFAKRVGNNITHELVNDIVNALVKRSFFDKGLFNRYSILTSKGIQNRWEQIVKGAKRKGEVDPQYRINSGFSVVSSEETRAIKEETTAITELSTQSKVKESKVKEIKENIMPEGLPDFDSLDDLKTIEEIPLNETFEEKEKEKSSAKKEKGIYPQFMDLYHSFILQRTGAPAKIDGAQGNAAKSIIDYLKVVSREKSEEGALGSWKHILEHWDKLEVFYRNKLKLTQINSDMINIINQIRNGTGKINKGYNPSKPLNSTKTVAQGRPSGKL